ncbi:GNAT family N-acetyltransferase [Fulvivirgaceae bacterium LMO-SS25]
MVDYLKWDSEQFGYKVGKITLCFESVVAIETDIDFARKDGYKLIYLFQEASESTKESKLNERLALLGFDLVDEKVLLSRDLNIEWNNFVDERIHPFNLNMNLDRIYSLALQTGEYSRFHLDKNFINNEFQSLYKIWLDNSISGKIADQIFVSLSEDSLPTGLITLGKKGDRVDIGLLGVDQNLRGQKLGQALVHSAFSYTLKRDLSQIQVVTQKANKPAMAFYIKMGFRIETITNIYHYWIK